MLDSDPEGIVEAHFIFSGYVQGVGFRATARHIAERLNIRGYVRNRIDGTVELYVQASKEAIESMQGEIKKRFPSSRVDSLSYHDVKVKEGDFRILPTN